MSELKMSDVFVLPVSSCKGDLFNSKNPISDTRVCKFFNMNQFAASKAAARAINNHDKLTEQNKKLIAMVEQLKENYELANYMCEHEGYATRYRQDAILVDLLLNSIKEQS